MTESKAYGNLLDTLFFKRSSLKFFLAILIKVDLHDSLSCKTFSLINLASENYTYWNLTKLFTENLFYFDNKLRVAFHTQYSSNELRMIED